MSRDPATATDCTAIDLAAYDVVFLDHDKLDSFVAVVGGPAAVPPATTVFTDDDHTVGTVEFNLIVIGVTTRTGSPRNSTTRSPLTTPSSLSATTLTGPSQSASLGISNIAHGVRVRVR